MNKFERLDLVKQACLHWVWRPAEVQRFIKNKTGVKIAFETIQKDLALIRENDRMLFQEAGQFGAMHVISKFIKDLGYEESNQADTIKQLHAGKGNAYAEGLIENMIDSEDKQVARAGEFLKEAVYNFKISKVAGKKAWLYGRLNEQRQFYLDILEAYPLYGAVTKRVHNSATQEGIKEISE